MKICAILRLVPDLVEEIEVEENEIIPFRYMPNERDEHAVEEAIILKEKTGAEVEVIGIADSENEADLDEGLGMAAAKGADKLYKVVLDRPTYKRCEIAKALADFLSDKNYDLILTGIQAIDSYAGNLGGILARYMDLPYIGGVVEVNVSNGNTIVKKELGGGLLAEYKLPLPAVVSVVSAERPLKFVPFTKLRQAMKKANIEEVELELPEIEGVEVLKYEVPPEPEITLIEGDVEEVADKLIEALKELSIL